LAFRGLMPAGAMHWISGTGEGGALPSGFGIRIGFKALISGSLGSGDSKVRIWGLWSGAYGSLVYVQWSKVEGLGFRGSMPAGAMHWISGTGEGGALPSGFMLEGLRIDLSIYLSIY